MGRDMLLYCKEYTHAMTLAFCHCLNTTSLVRCGASPPFHSFMYLALMLDNVKSVCISDIPFVVVVVVAGWNILQDTSLPYLGCVQ